MNPDPSNTKDAGERRWHQLTVLPETASSEMLAKAAVRPASPWFSGHFPGEPILPGIAQIALVLETIRQAEERDVCLVGLKRVRFKQVIQPDDEITIKIKPRDKKDDSYSFQVVVNDEVACSGLLIVAAAGSG